MNIDICKLTPNHAEDYVNFFDATPHDDNVIEHKCYCVCWCSENSENRDFSSREKRREIALQYVKERKIQGYLAYSNDEVVGWCNANTRADCLNCESWRRFMEYVPVQEEPNVKIKSIFCFVISPKMWRTGISTQLLDFICKDATRDGFDYIEAYPNNKSIEDEASNFGGYYEMYKKAGFTIISENEKDVIVRKYLK